MFSITLSLLVYVQINLSQDHETFYALLFICIYHSEGATSKGGIIN